MNKMKEIKATIKQRDELKVKLQGLGKGNSKLHKSLREEIKDLTLIKDYMIGKL
jgi:hypothetical protein